MPNMLILITKKIYIKAINTNKTNLKVLNAGVRLMIIKTPMPLSNGRMITGWPKLPGKISDGIYRILLIKIMPRFGLWIRIGQ